jgi:hypothetical protein
MSAANHRVRESCLICEGQGKNPQGLACAYCQGSGFVFAVSGAPQQVLLATGDCRLAAKKQAAQGLHIQKRFS